MLIQLAHSDFSLLSYLSILSTSLLIIFQIYINCFFGNEIKIESSKVSLAAYFSNWELLGKDSYKSKQYVLLLMVRSHAATLIKIGKFADLNLETFVALAKASYSYFSFLAQTQGK